MDPQLMGTLQRFLRGGRSSSDDRTDERAPSPALSSGEAYAAIRRERELHRLMLVEMERRGPEATAEDIYDELASRWDAEHPAGASSDTAGAPFDPAADPNAAAAVVDAMPVWAAEMVEQQRVTNELLERLVALLEEPRRDRA